jgi:hypothetical protein
MLPVGAYHSNVQCIESLDKICIRNKEGAIPSVVSIGHLRLIGSSPEGAAIRPGPIEHIATPWVPYPIQLLYDSTTCIFQLVGPNYGIGVTSR